ncbi:hypothetical protein RND71_042537 [Anisodus tanguticus]|uniref:Hexosyltransferase n=1 Tax=Anisodus tanguticus TaxID=243964 RepID=A0AAE1UUR4_9SOLA|nr:hypothetical protein RND71_042537 [Anisodus tanguticus]
MIGSGHTQERDLAYVFDDCETKNSKEEDMMGEFNEAQVAIYIVRSLDNSIAKIQSELPSTKAPLIPRKTEAESTDSERSVTRKNAFMVIGINTAFSSRKRRDSIRDLDASSMQLLNQAVRSSFCCLQELAGTSNFLQTATSNSILDRAIDSEDAQHKDILRLDHIEGYHELSAKTKAFFSAAVAKWDAEFYVKIDDDVHVNLGTLAATLARHRSVKYHEPEFWKFGETGNKYFRHATGQIYAISKELATYIANNKHILHKYANEDVSLGAWLIGLEVEHIDDSNLCCGTPPDNVCVASFDWSCSGICKSVERIKHVHTKCSESPATLWGALI